MTDAVLNRAVGILEAIRMEKSPTTIRYQMRGRAKDVQNSRQIRVNVTDRPHDRKEEENDNKKRSRIC